MGKKCCAKPGSIDAVAENILEIIDRPDPHAVVRNAAQAIAQARDAGDGVLRQQHLEEAQEYIAQIDPRQRRTIQQLQGQMLALQGRGGDTKIAHVMPGEVVVPRHVLDPELASQLAEAMRNAGLDPNGRVVGSRRANRNPRTGYEEFNSSDDELDPSWQTPWTPYVEPIEGITVSASRDPVYVSAPGGWDSIWNPQVSFGSPANTVPSSSGGPTEGPPPLRPPQDDDEIPEIIVPSEPGDTFEVPPAIPDDVEVDVGKIPNWPFNPPAYDEAAQKRIADMIIARRQLERQYEQETRRGNSDLANAIKNAIDRIDKNFAAFGRGIFSGV